MGTSIVQRNYGLKIIRTIVDSLIYDKQRPRIAVAPFLLFCFQLHEVDLQQQAQRCSVLRGTTQPVLVPT